jgi:hypothetical protein
MTGIVRREPSSGAMSRPAASPGRDGGAVGPTSPSRPEPELTVDGRPVEYVPVEYDIDQSWAFVPEATRQWATVRAGEPINDPVTKSRRQYRWCTVATMSGAGGPAEYDLTVFGKRGLVVARGVSDEFVAEPGRTRWRTVRWEVPLDPTGIRHDHHSSAMGQAPGAPTPAPSSDGASGDGFGDEPDADDVVTALLGDGTLAGYFGNLPTATQRFLLQPFVRSDSDPQDVGVNPHHTVEQHEETEEFWAHLFNKRWVAFCYARRTAPRRGRKASAQLDKAPWAVAAWVAPALPPDRAALPAP